MPKVEKVGRDRERRVGKLDSIDLSRRSRIRECQSERSRREARTNLESMVRSTGLEMDTRSCTDHRRILESCGISEISRYSIADDSPFRVPMFLPSFDSRSRSGSQVLGKGTTSCDRKKNARTTHSFIDVQQSVGPSRKSRKSRKSLILEKSRIEEIVDAPR